MSSSPPVVADACARPGLITVEQARAFLLERARLLPAVEPVAVADALARVLAGDVHAGIDVPGFANSSMDGYAVCSVDLAGTAPVRLRLSGRIAAGMSGGVIARGEAARIFTGAPVPTGADTVVMQEDCRVEGNCVWVPAGIRAGDNVRPQGNNIAAGSVVLAAGQVLRPQDLGIAAAIGLTSMTVRVRPRVAVLASGSELVPPGDALSPGRIYNSNTATLSALLTTSGCRVLDQGTVADNREATREALLLAAGCSDLVVSSGGVSVGDEDHMKAALEEVGSLQMWQVAVKPGKPLTYGRIGDADYLGLPGNPVSVLVTFCLFVRPFLLRRLGLAAVLPRWHRLRAGFDWPRPGRRREYLRARVAPGDDGLDELVLFPRQGSDVLASTVWADGLVEVAEATVVRRGDLLPYITFTDLLAGTGVMP